MQSAIAFLAQHRIAVSLVAVALVLIGVMFTRGRTSVSLSAKSGGVVVGRNNSGIINTGKTDSPASDRLIAIVGVIVAILGVVVAAIAWLYPKTPS